MLLTVCCNDLEDSSPPRCDTVSLGKWLPTFRRTAVEALSSGSNSLWELLAQ